jgi:ectoine hydroxylase-related dioxygenase (phytanoyl-CoA dioxygenase family)
VSAVTSTLAQAAPPESLVAAFRRDGHATLPGVFTEAEMDEAVADALAWVGEIMPTLSGAERAKIVESDKAGLLLPRWIDHPVLKRPVFRALAAHPRLVAAVEALIGRGVDVYFSQTFFKPPEAGSPKPAHQDNFYAGPNRPDGLVTVWVALDAAEPGNGCLEFVDGSHEGPIHPHAAPPDEPFHLQIPAEILARLTFTRAPVPKGGVSFHHGGTIHRSGANTSPRWRRAVAITYVTKDTLFADPKLNYDSKLRIPIT